MLGSYLSLSLSLSLVHSFAQIILTAIGEPICRLDKKRNTILYVSFVYDKLDRKRNIAPCWYNYRAYAVLYTLQLSRDHHEDEVNRCQDLVHRVEWEAGLAERRMEQRLLAIREPHHARDLRLQMHEEIERGLVRFDLLQGRSKWWWYALPSNEYHLLYCGCTPTGYRCHLCRALCNCHIPAGTCRFCDRFL